MGHSAEAGQLTVPSQDRSDIKVSLYRRCAADAARTGYFGIPSVTNYLGTSTIRVNTGLCITAFGAC